MVDDVVIARAHSMIALGGTDRNTAFGSTCGPTLVDASNSTFVGAFTPQFLATSTHNTAMGQNAMLTTTAMSLARNVHMGVATHSDFDDCICLGNGATTQAAGSIALGGGAGGTNLVTDTPLGALDNNTTLRVYINGSVTPRLIPLYFVGP